MGDALLGMGMPRARLARVLRIERLIEALYILPNICQQLSII